MMKLEVAAPCSVAQPIQAGRNLSGVFEVRKEMASHQIRQSVTSFDFQTQGEPNGQLLCCLSGEVELSGPTGRWSIPADHMVYIPGNRPFSVSSLDPSALAIVKFNRDEVAWQHNGCWVGSIGEFARQMIDYGERWAEQTDLEDRVATSYFLTLGTMLPDWFKHERINWTPFAVSEPVQKAVKMVLDQGLSLSVTEVAKHVGMSERTLRRKLQSEIGQSWREFIRELRMNRAMEMLRRDRRSVTETAFELGFASSSAFTFAFSKYVGQTPSGYAKSFIGLAQTAPQ